MKQEVLGISNRVGKFLAGPHQQSHSWFRVSLDSLRNITVSQLSESFNFFNKLEELIRVRVRVTLGLAAYRQSVRLGEKPLETHDQ
jgi:hypothetical protein